MGFVDTSISQSGGPEPTGRMETGGKRKRSEGRAGKKSTYLYKRTWPWRSRDVLKTSERQRKNGFRNAPSRGWGGTAEA